MDLTSLDFGTWRLVGLGLLGLGVLATVIAVFAIIVMFRDGDERDEADWDDDEDDDEYDDARDTGRRTVAAATAAREGDSGPTSLPMRLQTPEHDVFTVTADVSPRQSTPSTREEPPHVPSPDYEYADAQDAEPVAKDAETESPSSTPASSLPTGTAPEQPVPRVRQRPQPQASKWFDDPTGGHKESPSVPTRQSDPAPLPPVPSAWEESPVTSAAPEPPVAPARQEADRQTTERHVEPAEPEVVEVEPSATSRQSETRSAAASTRERQESDLPEADWYDDPDGSGGERWWDGKGWTRHRRPRSGEPMTTDSGRQRAAAKPQTDPPAADAGRRRTATTGSTDEQGGQTTSRAPGWYRDPSGTGGRRFWDGSRWTTGA